MKSEPVRSRIRYRLYCLFANFVYVSSYGFFSEIENRVMNDSVHRFAHSRIQFVRKSTSTSRYFSNNFS